MALLTCGRGQWLAHGIWQTDRWAARCLSCLRLTTLIRMDVTILRGWFVSVAPARMLFLVHCQPWRKCLLIVSRCHTLLSVDVIISGAVWIWMKHDMVTYSSRLHAHMQEWVSSCLNKYKTDCVQMQEDNVACAVFKWWRLRIFSESHLSYYRRYECEFAVQIIYVKTKYLWLQKKTTRLSFSWSHDLHAKKMTTACVVQFTLMSLFLNQSS